MAKRTELTVCASCGETVPITLKTPNHALHVVLSILTMGLWLVVYLAAILDSAMNNRFSRKRCPKCNGRL
ncbi:MAG: hypothetical protein KDJ69_12000 [Nitratireductor sp.]|nr:hypothetical protein [Nitratireductor sp.]